MKRIIQKIKRYSKSIDLGTDEKADLRAQVVAFMHATPMEDVARIPKKRVPVMSPYWAFFNVVKQPLVFSLIVTIIAGASISWAAEGALPGDALYTVKVNVTEPVQDVFVIGVEEQARWDAEKAERRIEEIELLIAQNNLDEERKPIAQQALDHAFETLEVSVAELQAESPEKKDLLRAGFVAKLDAHTAVLQRMNQDVAATSSNLSNSIAATKQHVSKNTVDDVIPAPTYTSASEKMRVAEERLVVVSERIERAASDTKESKRASRILSKAYKSFEEGAALLDEHKYSDAREAFVESMTLAQEAKLTASVPKLMSFDIVETATSTTETDVQFVPEKEKEVDEDIKKEVTETIDKATDALFPR